MPEIMTSRRRAKSWAFTFHKDYEHDLRDSAEQWFRSKRYFVNKIKPFILKSWAYWKRNIICDDVAKYIDKARNEDGGKRPFLLHKYIHHGLSSQAMIFNLLGPLIVRRDLEPFMSALLEINIDFPEVEVRTQFEFEDRKVFNEDAGQPTSFDLAILGKNVNLFIEAKLAEREFGSCSIFKSGNCDGHNPCTGGLNECYLNFIDRLYWQRMKEYGFLDGAISHSPICPLANYYQFFRELLFAIHNNGKYILLHDERNPAFIKYDPERDRVLGLWPFLKQFVPEIHKDKLASMTIQQIVRHIELSKRHKDWIGEFKSKYGL
ncbi:MAG TPA: hypothetical protein ENO22_12765 [candidate division Zixibacteria bacterium]|nr:hypothetical protein [candidate division Zixibacteria bacterium]